MSESNITTNPSTNPSTTTNTSTSTNLPICFTYPKDEGYTVYTKSGCQYCDQVKSLFSKIISQVCMINCDLYLVDKRPEFLEWIGGLAEKEVKTFPMVFHKGKFVGGFRETQEHYDTLDAFSYIDSF